MAGFKKNQKKTPKVICPAIFVPQEDIRLAIGYSRSWALQREKEDPNFPRRRTTNGVNKGWLFRELEDYFKNLPVVNSEKKATNA